MSSAKDSRHVTELPDVRKGEEYVSYYLQRFAKFIIIIKKVNLRELSKFIGV